MNFYRKNATIEFKIIGPKYETTEKGNSYMKSEGCVFISMIPAISEKKYDQSKQITFALSDGDMPALFKFFVDYKKLPETKLSLIHDTNQDQQNVKSFNITKIAKGNNVFAYNFSLSLSKNKTNAGSISLTLGIGEMLMVEEYIRAAFPKIMGI